MSYHVFFSFSTGFSKTLRVPKGTFERIWGRIKYTEERPQYACRDRMCGCLDCATCHPGASNEAEEEE